MKYNISQKLFTTITIILLLVACSKEEKPTTGNGQNNTVNTPVVSLEDTICRNWEVKNATHNGTNDPSSLGLRLSIKKDGSYFLHSTSYTGTWEFIENKQKVLLDKGSSSYKTTWTIKELTAKKMRVTFTSPFTGGAAEWEMKPY